MDAGLKTYRERSEQQARDNLIVAHLSFVKHILGKLIVDLPSFIDIENLEAAGILGLVEAANRFSNDFGVKFKNYAYQRIRGAIFDELRRNCPLPQQQLQHWSLIRGVMQASAIPVSPQVIASQTGLTVEEVEECLVAIRMTAPESWSDDLQVVGDQSEVSDNLDAFEQERRLADLIEELPHRMRAILTLYYLEDLTLKQIGEVVDLSESRVSRILTQAEVHLRNRLRSTID